MKQTLPLLSNLLLEPDGGSIKRRSKHKDLQGLMHNMQSCNMKWGCGSIETGVSFLPNTQQTLHSSPGNLSLIIFSKALTITTL